MCTIPAVTLVKATPSLGTVYYIDLAKHEVGSEYRISETRRLGFVEKDNSKWYAYARRTDASVSVALGHFPTRKAAVQAVVTLFVQMLDEVIAHEIQDALIKAAHEAEQAHQRNVAHFEAGEKDALCYLMPLGQLRENIERMRGHVAALLSEEEAMDATNFAFALRKRELLLDYLTQAQERDHALAIEIQDSIAVESTASSEADWEARIQELAEELGRAQAHAIRNASTQYRRVSDDELLEEVVSARRALHRQREQGRVNPDSLRTAAFAYQLLLNISHDQALEQA